MLDNSTTFSILEDGNTLTKVVDDYATNILSKRLDEAILYFIHKYNLTMSDMKKSGGIIKKTREDGSIIIDIIYKQESARAPDYKYGRYIEDQNGTILKGIKYRESLIFKFDTKWEIK